MIEIPGYRILRPLGQGGMATVYLAVQESLGREVALKVLAPALAQDSVACERFLREARTAAKLHHPHIIAIHDVGVHAGTPFMSISYESGGTVAQTTRAQEDPKFAFRIVRDIAEALDYAHRQGVVHRDVKPENILLRPDGNCVLSDFGIAHAVEAQTGLTREGTSVGTPHYMSPEQLRGEHVDGRSDLYSLGVVFYQLLTGELPYQGTDGWAIGMQHIMAPIPKLPARLAYLQELLDGMLAKDPSARLQSGAEVVRWIDARVSIQTPAMTVAMPTSRGIATEKAAQVSIAVLPFVDLSQGKDQEYFVEGLTDEILNLLARVPKLHVASRTATATFRGRNASLAEMGRELKVASVLEGSVRKSNERLRVSVQLINVADGYNLWSETYNRDLTDVFAVQEEIAQAVIEALREKLLPADPDSPAEELARQLQLARERLAGETHEDAEAAIAAFARVLAIDPAHTEAKYGSAAAQRALARMDAATAAERAAEQAKLEASEREAAAARAAEEARTHAAERAAAEQREREASERAAEEARRREAAEQAAAEAKERERLAAEQAAEQARQRDAAARAAEQAREREAAALAAQQAREAAARAEEEARQREAAARAAEEQRQREAAARAAEEARQQEAAALAADQARQQHAAEMAAARAAEEARHEAEEARAREAAARAAEEQRQRKVAARAAEEQRQREAAARAAEEQRQRDAAQQAAAEARRAEAEAREAAERASAEDAARRAAAAAAPMSTLVIPIPRASPDRAADIQAASPPADKIGGARAPDPTERAIAFATAMDTHPKVRPEELPPPKRNPLPLVAGGVVVLALAAVGAWMVIGGDAKEKLAQCQRSLVDVQAALASANLDAATAALASGRESCTGTDIERLTVLNGEVELARTREQSCLQSEAQAATHLDQGQPALAGTVLDDARENCGSRPAFVAQLARADGAGAEARRLFVEAAAQLKSGDVRAADTALKKALATDANLPNTEALRSEIAKRIASLPKETPATTPAPKPAVAEAAPRPEPTPKPVAPPPKPAPTTTALTPPPPRPVVPTPTPTPPPRTPTTTAPTPAATAPIVAAAPLPPPPPAPTPAPATRKAALVPISTPAPAFPDHAQRARISGYVVVTYTVGTDGRVSNVRIVDSKPKGVFERTVQTTLGRWRYEPPAAARDVTHTFDFDM